MLFLETVTCDDVALANILVIVKRVLSLIQIVGPILCIVSLIYTFIKMSINPDEKNNPKRIVNIVLALVIMFFVPVIVNAVMLLLDDSTDISSCWKLDQDSVERSHTYVEIDEGEGSKIYEDDYTVTTNTAEVSNKMIFIGDSRTVQTYAYLTGD